MVRIDLCGDLNEVVYISPDKITSVTSFDLFCGDDERIRYYLSVGLIGGSEKELKFDNAIFRADALIRLGVVNA